MLVDVSAHLQKLPWCSLVQKASLLWFESWVNTPLSWGYLLSPQHALGQECWLWKRFLPCVLNLELHPRHSGRVQSIYALTLLSSPLLYDLIGLLILFCSLSTFCLLLE